MCSHVMSSSEHKVVVMSDFTVVVVSNVAQQLACS
jgi:hypothetical protein